MVPSRLVSSQGSCSEHGALCHVCFSHWSHLHKCGSHRRHQRVLYNVLNFFTFLFGRPFWILSSPATRSGLRCTARIPSRRWAIRSCPYSHSCRLCSLTQWVGHPMNRRKGLQQSNPEAFRFKLKISTWSGVTSQTRTRMARPHW